MSYSAYDFRTFYKSRPGRLVRRFVTGHAKEIWPDITGRRIMGYGYTSPYLRAFKDKAERCFSVMPQQIGVCPWPDDGPGRNILTQETNLPFETESIDRLLVIHGFEYAEAPYTILNEFWRVLKSDGRLMIIVPNRLGLWARAEWTPFATGTPYTEGQLVRDLKNLRFAIERKEKALFMPPFRSFFVLRAAYSVELFGRFMFSGLAGLHMIEAGKNLYAGIPNTPAEERVRRRIITGAPYPAS